MSYSTDQVVRGIINYADNEVMVKLPTTAKWVMGTIIGIASTKSTQVIENLKHNPIVNALGVVDEAGNIDVDTIILSMKDAAEKYGNLTLDVAMLGKMTFSAADIDRLRSYIQ